MNIIPAIDIRGGRCVQLVGGRPGTERVRIDDVLEVALRWQDDGARMIHIVDLDSALGSGDNSGLIQRIMLELSVPVQVGGGIRSMEKVDALFEMGAERVVIGTKAVEDPRFLREASEAHPNAVVASVDSSAGVVLVDGWRRRSHLSTTQAAEAFSRFPIWGFLFTDVDVEGRLQGVDVRPVAELVKTANRPVMASGGVATKADLASLRDAGTHSVVVGMAIYTGFLDFGEIVREFA